MSELTREQIEQSLYELQRELAVAKVDADHFFQLSGQYLERANKAEEEAEALRKQVRMWKEFAIEFRNDGNVADKDYSLVERFDAALGEGK